MPLLEKLEQDFLDAMKAKDAMRVSVLRLIKAAVTNYRIAHKKEALTDSDVIEILQRQAKQRQESLESFEKAKRSDLAEKERKELALIQLYLPKAMSDDEILSLAAKAIEKSGAKSKAEVGKVMKELMPAVKGRADGKKVNEIALSLLS